MCDIDPALYKKFNIKEIREPIEPGSIEIPYDHAIYDDVMRMVDEYEDKWFLYNFLKEQEIAKLGDKVKRYNALIQLKEMEQESNLVLRVGSTFNTMYNKEINDPNINIHELHKRYFKENVPSLFPMLKEEHLAIFNGNPQLSNRKLDQEIEKLKPYVEKYENNSFAEYIKSIYNPQKDRTVKMALRSDAYNIFKQVERIKDNFFNVHFNLEPQKYTFELNEYQPKRSVKYEVCRILEKHYGLLYNPSTDTHYISDGQGKYITFDSSNDNYIYTPLRNQFYALRWKDGKTKEQKLLWTKAEFYDIGNGFSTVKSEAESNIIGFKNCCLDIEKRIIYKLDPHFPRLPIKSCKVNYVYDQDLTNTDNPLKTVFEECFDQETRETIYKYYGRALFEEGYTYTQDVLLLLGKGGVGKTKFITACSEVFNNMQEMSADKITPDNKLAFSSLPGADFIVMDELTNVQKGFTEKLKELTGGSKTLQVEMKGKNPINLPSTFIPRMVCIGNQLPYKIFKHFVGSGVIRRFCIVFLKRSILEAKKMTKKIDGITYCVTKDNIILKDTYTKDDETYGYMCKDDGSYIIGPDGNKVEGMQGRTYFEVEELTGPGCLEWFLQEIMIHYKKEHKSLLDEETAKERALMAYSPEKWSAARWLEPVRDDEGNLDTEETLTGTQILEKLHEDVNKFMLEKTITNPNSGNLKAIVANICHFNNTDEYFALGTGDNFDEVIYKGIKILPYPKKVDIDKLWEDEK